jgi:signal transduction histidine kinase
LSYKGNRHAFVQVFVNLFINSMYAMPDGGEIYVNIVGDSDKIEVRVRDTGTGIPEDILPRVSEALFTTKGKMGSGLGLSICKEIVEIEHAGELSIVNHPKGGVEVTLCLPLHDGGKP